MMGNFRCISFGMDYLWRSRELEKDKPVKPYSLMDLLVYNFYFPLLANGPVVTFDTFQKTVSSINCTLLCKSKGICPYIAHFKKRQTGIVSCLQNEI